MSDAVKLPARLDLSNAMQLVSDLRAVEGDVKVDASDASHLGALGLQALAAAARKAVANGHTFEMDGTSDRVIEQLKMMGSSPEHLKEGCP